MLLMPPLLPREDRWLLLVLALKICKSTARHASSGPPQGAWPGPSLAPLPRLWDASPSHAEPIISRSHRRCSSAAQRNCSTANFTLGSTAAKALASALDPIPAAPALALLLARPVLVAPVVPAALALAPGAVMGLEAAVLTPCAADCSASLVTSAWLEESAGGEKHACSGIMPGSEPRPAVSPRRLRNAPLLACLAA